MLLGITAPHPFIIEIQNGRGRVIRCGYISGPTPTVHVTQDQSAGPPFFEQGARASYGCSNGAWLAGDIGQFEGPGYIIEYVAPGVAGEHQSPAQVGTDGRPWVAGFALVSATSRLQYDDPRCPAGAYQSECLTDLFNSER